MESNVKIMTDADGDAVAHMVGQWQRVLPELDASPLLTFGRLQRISALIHPALRPTFAAVDLGVGDFDVLAALRRHDPSGPLPVGDLAEAMLVTAGAITKRVDRLVAAGLVTRQRSATDGRGRSIRLTERGRVLTDQLIERHLRNEAALLQDLTRDEQEQLANLLARLLAGLEGRGR